MPKVRVLVPTSNPKTGEPLAAGAEVDLDDEAYQALRQQGAVAASEEDTKAGQRDYDEKTGLLKREPGTGKGNYTARTGRADVGDEPPPPPEPKPQTAPKK